MDIAASLKTAVESLVTTYVTACANPKPSYSVEGQSVSWGEYLKMLADAIKQTQELIPLFDPFWLESVVT